MRVFVAIFGSRNLATGASEETDPVQATNAAGSSDEAPRRFQEAASGAIRIPRGSPRGQTMEARPVFYWVDGAPPLQLKSELVAYKNIECSGLSIDDFRFFDEISSAKLDFESSVETGGAVAAIITTWKEGKAID